ncbi:hypothetical protein RMI40_31170 [Pseudomonas protegens]|uniref:hypothetical protein n=1 Tax=Pseudomonas protegens TaxID=380021 RepID=UPI0023EA7F46|nr:hypothetical protein [Pseudomonas protegens]MDF4205079.1 hypothetical protein [Pseudomonas protegens]MDK1397948.1 hypothetical protein [Pseudomonas protegens]MDS9879300.1 hypothetical protein [Pseudomonas protegens]
MERDKKVVLSLLADIQGLERLHGVDERNLENSLYGEGGCFDDSDFYHLQLLVSGGFLAQELDDVTGISTLRMTWSGHDLLEQLQEEFSKV